MSIFWIESLCMFVVKIRYKAVFVYNFVKTMIRKPTRAEIDKYEQQKAGMHPTEIGTPAAVTQAV